MIGWLFSSLGHIIVGLVLLVGFFVGAVWTIGRAIASGAEHDTKKCDCADCTRRRGVALQKRWAADDHQQRRSSQIVDDIWLTTDDLFVGMRVNAGERFYMVTALNKMTGVEGVAVHLRDLATHREFFIMVTHTNRKYWKRAPWG